MVYFKKLIFAPIFLAFITSLIYFYKLILDKHTQVFFGNYGGLYDFGIFALILLLSSLTYCLFVTFTQSIKYVLSLALLSISSSFIFLNTQLAIITGAGIFLSLLAGYFALKSNLSTYVNFKASSILSGPIKSINLLILLTLSLGYYLNANLIIQTQGFKIPDPLIDFAIDLSLGGANIPVLGEKYYIAQTGTFQEQLEYLKKHPELMEEYGLKPEDLETFSGLTSGLGNETPLKPRSGIKDVIKTQISDSLDQAIKPYLFVVAIILAVLFFSEASFILWLLSLLLSPMLLLLFYIFEKTGFVKYEKEMREVKKIVV